MVNSIKMNVINCIYIYIIISGCDSTSTSNKESKPIIGCTNPMACNYNVNAIEDNGTCSFERDCSGECGGIAVIDECGVCGGDNDCLCLGYSEDISKDCAGICGGTSILDECGVCGGSGIIEGKCDCMGNILDECGVCGGSGIIEGKCDCAGNILDRCGVCGGDDSTCELLVKLSLVSIDGKLNVSYDSNADIYGFQFEVENNLANDFTILSASGGESSNQGLNISSSSTLILGFSLSKAFIPAGSGILTIINYEGSGTICISSPVFSDANGYSIDVQILDCVTI